jgi:AcrR family transcriptional regulator
MVKNTKAGIERTREALLDAAEHLFWERGAARAAVLDIARTAGLTRGAFYHHFRDKAEVLAALIERSRDPQYDPPTLVESEPDPLGVLQSFCTDVFHRFATDRRQQRMFAILMQGPETLGDLEPLARVRREEIFRSLGAYQTLLERARHDGRLSPLWSPETAATILYSMMFGLLDQWLREPDSFDIHAAGSACVSQMFCAFRDQASPKN